jgi:putative FmdB family regulatory protein
MPTYEYECKKCGNRFEKFQAIREAPLTTCESCGGQVRRVVTGGAGVIFKGSGFYVTDKNSKNPTIKSGKEKDNKDTSVEGNKDDLLKKTNNEKPSKKETCAACPASQNGACSGTEAA